MGGELSCPVCGSGLVFDGLTHSYVCPGCGLVYDYELVPSRTHLTHAAPPDRRFFGRLRPGVVERAAELFGSSVAAELMGMRGPEAEEVLRALEAAVLKRDYSVSWRALRRALEIASRHGLATDLAGLRGERVRSEIERLVRELGLPVDPGEVWRLAVANRELWAGRRASTVAKVFTYIYCRRRGIEVRLDPRTARLAQALERVVRDA